MTMVYRPGKQLVGAAQMAAAHEARNVWVVPGSKGTFWGFDPGSVRTGVSASPDGLSTWEDALVEV